MICEIICVAVQLSFHTMFTQTHIVNAIYMLLHISVSFTFLIYLITCNLISAYCLHTHMSCTHHLYVICTAAHVHIICILSEHMCIMHILSALVLHMFFPNRQCQCDLYDRNLLLNGICGRNVEFFHFRIM